MVALLEDPVFVFLVVTLLVIVFLAFLFLRRTVLSLREGYDEGYE